MTFVRLSLFVPLAFAFALGGCGGGPFGLMSGGALDGEVRSIPASWDFVGSSGQAQLETNPAAPYSVNLNYTLLDGSLYLNAGDSETQWVQNMKADPEVRLRIRRRHLRAARRSRDGPRGDASLREGLDGPGSLHARPVRVGRGLGLPVACSLVACVELEEDSNEQDREDPRIDPRIKAVMGMMPSGPQPDVASREALIAEVNTPKPRPRSRP